jgi:hypothetical protein
MSRRQVGRPPAGNVAKEQSATARRAYVAARLEQQYDQSFIDGLGVSLSRAALSRAGTALLWHRPGYKPRGRHAGEPRKAQLSPPHAEPTAFRDWLAVDLLRLDLHVELLTVSFESKSAQAHGAKRLKAIPGVVQLMRVTAAGNERSVVAVALSDDDDDRQRLHEAVAGIGASREWHRVESETVEPAVATWRHLAQIAARREGLLGSPGGPSVAGSPGSLSRSD